ncbi:uncharacterized protein LOC143374886 [Andrena cerasifolii]|uniref:uncharacterized protein LOC143374886 n=1 Tax=Andrena cerasifolii TaxID=2819439 RepID=UPI0040376129
MSDIYCAEQIKIPPTFPHILKLYAKAAIRTQPYDLLRWTCAYFRALANDEVPPVKERLEYPPFIHPSGITPGYLKTLLNAFGPVETVCSRALLERWQGIVLPEPSLYRILIVGEFTTCCEWNFYEFLAIACGFLGKVSRAWLPKIEASCRDILSWNAENRGAGLPPLLPAATGRDDSPPLCWPRAQNLFQTMIYVCELLTEEPEGGSAMIPLRTFLRLYRYLAELDCSGECPRQAEPKDSEELFRPCGPPSVSYASSSAVDSSLNREPSAMEVASFFMKSIERRSIPSTTHRSAERKMISEIDEVHQPLPARRIEIETQPADDRKDGASQRSEASETDILKPQRTSDQDRAVDQNSVAELRPDDGGDSIYDVVDDSSADFGGEEGERETVSLGQADDYEPIGLESILHGICECLEPAREAERAPTPQPDPLEQFHERMKNEVKEGRLQTVFHVPGIGPTVSVTRITAVGLWLAECGRRQEGLVGPRDIRHFLCPNLDDHCDDEDGY